MTQPKPSTKKVAKKRVARKMSPPGKTIQDAHDRIDAVEKDLVAIKTQIEIQFKEIFVRIKRLEGIMIASSAAIIMMLASLLVAK